MGLPPYGTAASCPPAKYPLAKKGMIEWAWFPEFSWLKVVFLLTIAVVIIAMVLLGFGQKIAGGILLPIGIIAVYVFGNWHWNANKQMAYQIARGKSCEAISLWAAVDKRFRHMAKDTFFETRYGGKVLRVLRDGTIEMQGSHNDLDLSASSGMGDGMGEQAMESAIEAGMASDL